MEWAERLRARDLEGQGASGVVRVRASSPDDGGNDGFGGGAVEVVSGGDPERHSGIAVHARGAVGAENLRHLGRCSADCGRPGPRSGVGRAGLGLSGGAMIFGLWA